MPDSQRQSGRTSQLGYAKQSALGTYASPTNKLNGATWDDTTNANVEIYKTLTGALDSETEAREGILELSGTISTPWRTTQGVPLISGCVGTDTIQATQSFGTSSAAAAVGATFIQTSSAAPAPAAGIADWIGAPLTVDVGLLQEITPILQTMGSAAPSAMTLPTIAATTTPCLAIATYTYQATFVTAGGESPGSTATTGVLTTTGNTGMSLTGIAVGAAGTNVIGRRVYRATGGAYIPVAQIMDNTTTAFTDYGWAPTAPTAGTATTGGSLAAGTYTYVVTFVAGQGLLETVASPAATQVTTGSTSVVNLTVIPTGNAQQGVTARKIYRGIGGVYQLLTTISDNTTTTFTDSGQFTSLVTPPILTAVPTPTLNTSFNIATRPLVNAHLTAATLSVNLSHCIQPNIGSSKANLTPFSFNLQWATMIEHQLTDCIIDSINIKGDSKNLTLDIGVASNTTLKEVQPVATTITNGTGEGGDTPFKQQDGGLYTYGAATDSVMRLHQRMTAVDWKLMYALQKVTEGGNPQAVVQNILGERTQTLSWTDNTGEQAFRSFFNDFVLTLRTTPALLAYRNKVNGNYTGVYMPLLAVLSYDNVGPSDSPVAKNGSATPLLDSANTGISVRIWCQNQIQTSYTP